MTGHDDRFCDECGVSRDLHYDDANEPTPKDCEQAAAKADLMARFFGAFS